MQVITEGIAVTSQYNEGIVARVEKTHIIIEWADGDSDTYMIEDLEDEGFTFHS